MIREYNISLIDRLTILGLGTIAAAFLATLIIYWGGSITAVDRYLILAAVAWVAARRWYAVPVANDRAWPITGLLLVVFAAIPLPVAWFLISDVPSGRVFLLWWQWGTVVTLSAGCVLIRFGPATLRVLLFSMLFLAFAIPLPTVAEQPIKLGLQNWTTTASFILLRLSGLTVERPGGGHILRLPGGDLGVEEACSGVRSLVALTALAAFVAHHLGLSPLRGGLLLLVSVPVVWLVNTLRVVLSGYILEQFGEQYIRGDWHESLGIVMVLVGLGVITWVAAHLRRVSTNANVARVEQTTHPASPTLALTPTAGGRLYATASLMILVTVALSAVAGLAGRWPNRDVESTPDLAALPTRIGEWVGRDLPVPPHVSDELGYTAGLHREYRSRIGRRALVWVLYWSAANQVRGYHHPDVCLPNAGMRLTDRTVELLRPACGGRIPVTCRTLTGDRGGLFVQYWTQEGRRVWGESDEQAASAGLGVRGLMNRLGELTHDGHRSPPAGRVVVLVGTDDEGGWGKQDATEFVRLLADAVYVVHPAASPPTPPYD